MTLNQYLVDAVPFYYSNSSIFGSLWGGQEIAYFAIVATVIII